MTRLILTFMGWVMLGAVSAQDKRPNVILMLADDIGYSDISYFGGEIPTPNIDKLFSQGAAFTQFYNGARCCPTRASLLTGLYAHQAGVGYMTADWEHDAYRGRLSDEARTIGEVMKANGYQTFMTGKWHVGNQKNGQAPYNRGFDRSWWNRGPIDYFRKSEVIIYDGKPWSTDDPDYYLTDYTASFAGRFIEEMSDTDKPFFGYVAWDACHWPLQAKETYIQRHLKTYGQGWDKIRQGRLSKQLDKELVDPQWSLPGRDPAVPAWSEVDEREKERWIRKMATYAAQLQSLDENIGRILQRLDELGIADNTYLMLLFDNGACPEAIGWNEQELIGSADSYASYNLPWANVSNTPFRTYKHFLYEGGISTPFILAGPGIGPQQVDAVGHIIDVLPTILDLTDGKYIREPSVKPLEGQSLVPVLSGEEEREWTFWEHEGNRAVRYGDWKLVSRYVNDTTYYSRWHFPKEPRTQEWELYNLKNDRTELREISAEHPRLVDKMITAWEAWADRVGVQQDVPTYDRYLNEK